MPLRTLISNLFILFSVSLFCQTNPHHVWVKGHYRKGTYIEGHYRTAPNHTNVDNFSTRGNTNPYTLQPGYIEADNQVNPWKEVTKEETIEVESFKPEERPTSHKYEPSAITSYSTNTANTYTGKYYSKGDQVNVRQSANVQSKIEFRINKGDPVRVLARSMTPEYISGYGTDYWYQAESRRLKGWVFGKLINKADEQEIINTPDDWQGARMTIQADHVNVPSDPAVSEGTIKFKLNKNAEVEVVAKTSNRHTVAHYGTDYWYYVKLNIRTRWAGCLGD